jgi:TonB family protein
MTTTTPFLSFLVAILAPLAVSAQAIYDGPMEPRDSNERCSAADEPGCHHGFIAVRWPQPIHAQCARPKYIPSPGAQPTFVQMMVDEGGRVTDAKVARSSGIAELDSALVAAAQKCNFTPGTRGGKPAPLKTMWIYRWNREGVGGKTYILTPTAPKN